MADCISVNKPLGSVANPRDVLISSHSKEKTLNSESSHANHFGGDKEKKTTKESDTDDDDFFSVKGEFSRSCSVSSKQGSAREDKEDDDDSKNKLKKEKKVSEQFQDMICEINQTHTRLFEFLKDDFWKEETAEAVDRQSRSGAEAERLKTEQAVDRTCSRRRRKSAIANHCCFPRRRSRK